MKWIDFNKEFGDLIPKGDYETIAGYIISDLGRIPNAGEHLFMNLGQVVIKKASDRYIEKILIYPKKKRIAKGYLGEIVCEYIIIPKQIKLLNYLKIKQII